MTVATHRDNDVQRRLAGVDAIGVPFDAYGRLAAVARPSTVLRGAGLLDRVARFLEVHDVGDLDLPPASAERARGSGLLNESVLLAVTASLRTSVARSLRGGRFPLVYGADCGVLLGIAAAMHEVFGKFGMVCLDAHADAYPLEDSPDGQIADSEIALLLGLTGENSPASLRALLPRLDPRALALIGIRTQDSLLPETVRIWDDTAVRAAPPEVLSGQVLARAADDERSFWLHVDLDVLSADAFSAHDFPAPGGIDWATLTAVTSCCLAHPACAGWSVVIYNPDLDPTGFAASHIVEYAANVMQVLVLR